MTDETPPQYAVAPDKLILMVPSYRAGYVSAGGRDQDVTDQDAVEKMQAAHVWNESLAEQTGRQDGFKAREEAQQRGKW